MGESDFFKQLDARGKRRYDEKLEILGLCSDPYATTSEDWESDPDCWPNVEFPDIFNYLIDSPSPHTKESLKAYKSTEAWAYFTAGYVTNVGLMKINAESCLLRAKVSKLFFFFLNTCTPGIDRYNFRLNTVRQEVLLPCAHGLA